ESAHLSGAGTAALADTHSRGMLTRSGGRRPVTRSGGRRPITRSGGRRPITRSGGRRPVTRSGGRRPITRSGGRRPVTRSGGRRPFTRSGGRLVFARDARPLPTDDAERAGCRPAVDHLTTTELDLCLVDDHQFVGADLYDKPLRHRVLNREEPVVADPMREPVQTVATL